MTDLEQSAFRLRMVFRAMLRRAEAIRGPGTPARSEQGILAWLDERGPMSPKALADAQKVRPQSVAQTLDVLARKRWIRRSPHPSDRRQLLISPTPAGERALAKGRSQRQAWLVGELRKLPPHERKALGTALDILERLIPLDTPAKS